MTKIINKLATLPTHTLSERQLYDLEMILSGGFAPLKGFIDKENYQSVLKTTRLVDGTVWPIPITLDTDIKYEIGQEVVLVDSYKTPLAIIKISSVFEPDIRKESMSVYGTLDLKHPGVAYLNYQTRKYYIGGEVVKVNDREHFDFVDIRRTPSELRKYFKGKLRQKNNIIAFQTRNPIHRAHFELIKKSAEKVNAQILIHPVVGPTKEGDIDYITRVRGYIKLVERLEREGLKITLSLLPSVNL